MKKTKGRKVAFVSGTALVVLLAIVAWNWSEILFAIDFQRLGRNEQGYPEYRHRDSRIVFVNLPGGTFLMGSPDSEEGHKDDEGPVHKVTLSPFMIAKSEVTQEQWEEVMGEGSNISKFRGENLPVEMVSWDDIQEFEAKTEFTLPTEAQWEYACRAGTKGPYAGASSLDDIGWNSNNSSRTSQQVGQKQPNRFGLHDMHGNVWEWCEDIYEREFYLNEDSGHDPLSTTGSAFRVVRGGGWGDRAQTCRCAVRDGDKPVTRYGFLGFRPTAPTP